MNLELSEYLLTSIGLLDYVDRWCGVVQTLSLEEKNFPAGKLLIGTECSRSAEISEIIPDSNYKGILFFEDKGISQTRNLTSAFGFRSDLRLICWLNGNKIKADSNLHSLSSFAIGDLTQKLSRIYPSNGIFIQVRPAVTGIAIQDASIFSKYDFNDKTSGYLQGAFEYFALDISVNYYVSKRCNFSFAHTPGCIVDPKD